MKTVAIFGGSFSPPHQAHFMFSEAVAKLVDEVWMTPCYNSRWGKSLPSGEHRLNMLNIGIKKLNNDKIKAFDWEIKNKASGSSWELLQAIKKNFPDIQFELALGMDNVVNFVSFKNYELIRSNFPIIAVNRKGQFPNTTGIEWYNHPPHKYLNVDLPGISSTEIKTCLKNGKMQKITGLDNDILQYIIDNELYEE